jgi:hypothetical protein
VNLAFLDVETYVIERAHASELLGDAAHADCVTVSWRLRIHRDISWLDGI